jgi:hypothetical protein
MSASGEFRNWTKGAFYLRRAFGPGTGLSSACMDVRKVPPWALISVGLILLAGMWGLFYLVMIPDQEAKAAARNAPRGNFSDLYPRWLGARELLLHQRDPYSAQMTQSIQQGYYGRVIDPGNPNDPSDPAGFAYPLFIVFLLAPTILLPFPAVQIIYTALGVAVSIASIWLWCRALGYSASFQVKAAAGVLFIASYPVMQSLHLQQPILLVAVFIAACLAFVATGELGKAGIVLALAMAKPQVTLPVAMWLLFWSASKWTDRKHFLMSFVATTAILSVSAELLLPGWIWKWISSVRAYSQQSVPAPPYLQLMFGPTLGTMLILSLLIIVGTLCWKARHSAPTTDRFKLMTPLILAANLVVNPVWREYDSLLLLPAVMLLVHWRRDLQILTSLEKAIICVSAGVLAWQWPAAVVVTATSFWSPMLARESQILPWLSVLFVPVPALVSLILGARAQLWLRETN